MDDIRMTTNARPLALVTGASSGIGLEVSLELARRATIC
jgi:NAD(P)-dependent dehydrogenase (short-subunit alcohol dehydrogenase family)